MRNKGIDGLKGIGCILIAFMWHYRHFGIKMPSAIENSGTLFGEILRLGFEKGWLMVEIFFILSGYVISVGYKEKIRNGMPFTAFTKKRINALWPYAVTTLICVTVLQYIYNARFGEYFVYTTFDLKHFLLNFFMVDLTKSASFNGPAWYVSVLFVIYILYYFIAKVTTRYDVSYKVSSMALSMSGWILYTKYGWPLFRGITCFFMGVFIGELVGFVHKKAYAACWGLFGGGVLFIAMMQERNWLISRLQAVTIFYIGPMLLLATCLSATFRKIMSLFPFLKLGEYSFGIFMWHFPVQLCIMLFNRLYGNKMQFSSLGTWFFYCICTVVWVGICKTVSKYMRICYQNHKREK